MDKETIMQLLADGVISNEVAARYFPELKESRDERIRQFLIRFVRYYKEDNDSDDFSKEDCLAWLEGQGEQKPCMIQWKGDNLKEVAGFTGKDKNFEKWFKSFEEYERYVLEHNSIFKLFNADGSHYEVPVGAWIVKTPDGYNVASKAIFRQKSVDTLKFKVGDKIRRKTPSSCDKDMQVARIEKDYYICNHIGKFSSEVVPFSKQSGYELIEQKPAAWSEDDEIRYKTTLDDLEAFLEDTKQKPPREILSLMSKDNILTQIQIDIDWFKSIKDRIQNQITWKPSDGQMELLKEACDRHWEPDGLDPLYTLYQDLKKLREE